MTAANTAEVQRGRPFLKGVSGNPAGKPKGARHKTSLAVEALLEGEAENITRKAIEMAKAGDITAIKLVLERLVPAKREREVYIELGNINTASDLAEASNRIAKGVGGGILTPGEAQGLMNILEGRRKIIDTHELAERITRLEEIRSFK